MLKWKSKKRNNSLVDIIDGKSTASDVSSVSSLSDQGSSDEKEFPQTLSEGDIFSPYEDIFLEDLYKRFRTTNKHESSLAELENSLELYQNNTSQSNNRLKPQKKSIDKVRSPLSLPIIDETDELVSIADSGISCDADDESEPETERLTVIQKSHYEPLKCDENLPMEENEGDLLTCINEELFKRIENDEQLRSHTLPRPDNFSASETPKTLKNLYPHWNLPNGGNGKSLPRRLDKDFVTKDDLNIQRKKPHTGKNKRPKSLSVDPVDLEESYRLEQQRYNKDFQNLLYDTMSLTNKNEKERNSSIDTNSSSTNNIEQNFYRQKENIPPLSQMSSMLWSGETSKRPPSTVEVYSTMPPNRYLRNKDFMTQLKTPSEEEVNTPPPREFRVNLDVSHYSPEEILVTLEDGKLVVNGKHFSESEYGFETCQFHRRYPIPSGIKKSYIKSKISEEGILTITGKQKQEVKSKPIMANRKSMYDNVDNMRKAKSLENLISEPSEVIPNTSDNSDIRSSFEELDSYEDQFQEINSNTYFLKVDCKGYFPEDLEVRVSRGELIVKGKHALNENDEGEERIKHQEFTKKFSIPRDADVETIISKFVGGESLHVESRKRVSKHIEETLTATL